MNRITGSKEGVDTTVLSPTSPIGKWVYGGSALLLVVGVAGALIGYTVSDATH